jgi:hypothetical protein
VRRDLLLKFGIKPTNCYKQRCLRTLEFPRQTGVGREANVVLRANRMGLEKGGVARGNLDLRRDLGCRDCLTKSPGTAKMSRWFCMIVFSFPPGGPFEARGECRCPSTVESEVLCKTSQTLLKLVTSRHEEGAEGDGFNLASPRYKNYWIHGNGTNPRSQGKRTRLPVPTTIS